MNLKWVWNVSEIEMWLKWIWKRLARTSFLPVWAQAPIRELSWRSVVWSSITSSLRHSRLGQERSEEEGCLTTLTMWRSHGCYLRCSPARNNGFCLSGPDSVRIRCKRFMSELTFYLLSAWHRLHCCPFSAQDQSAKHNAAIWGWLPKKKQILHSGSKVRIPSGIVRALVGFQLELGHWIHPKYCL